MSTVEPSVVPNPGLTLEIVAWASTPDLVATWCNVPAVNTPAEAVLEDEKLAPDPTAIPVAARATVRPASARLGFLRRKARRLISR